MVSGDLQYIPDPSSNNYSTQAMNLRANTVSANIKVSKRLLFITPYLGFGFVKTNFDLTMAGNYPTLGDPVKQGNTYKMQIKNITDPVKISQSEVMPGASIGLRAKILMVLSVHAQYTFSKISDCYGWTWVFVSIICRHISHYRIRGSVQHILF